MQVKFTFIISTFFLIVALIFGSNVEAQNQYFINQGTANILHLNKEVNKSLSRVNMIITDSSLMAFPTEIPAGAIEFIVSNQGEAPHEMVVLKITKPINQLPLKGKRLDEANSGTKIGEIESSELGSGATHRLTTNLKPGKYLLVSNVPGDYQAGMKVLLTVK